MGENYKPLLLTDNLYISLQQSSYFFSGLSVAGEIIPTKGPIEDGIAIVLDSAEAFIGDLLQEHEASELDDKKAKGNWENLRRMGVSKVFPATLVPTNWKASRQTQSRFEKDIELSSKWYRSGKS